jgi:RHS repeat-associated protein
VTTYDYDSANRLINISSPVASYSITLDENGNRTNINQNEPLAPVVMEGATAYGYNAKGNRLLLVGTPGFEYDNEGQLASGYGASYSFDYEHRLTGINGSSFNYDGNGNRLQAVRNGDTTNYIYDNKGNLLMSEGTDGIRVYIYGKGLLAVLSQGDRWLDVYCYHYNAIGSTVALTDLNKAVVNKYAYDPFGKITGQVEAVPQPFKFAGQHGVMTEPNGFNYMKARYYDPNVGRFISEDPIGFEGGNVNLYAYVGNNPVNRIDPSGLFENPFGLFENIYRPLPLVQDSFPKSDFAAPVADVVLGSIEAATAVTAGVAAGVTLFAPEFWWATFVLAPYSVEFGYDSVARITSGIEKLNCRR